MSIPDSNENGAVYKLAGEQVDTPAIIVVCRWSTDNDVNRLVDTVHADCDWRRPVVVELISNWELQREQDVLDLGAEVMLPDFVVEHPDGRRALFEIVGFWTPEYLNEKLAKIRAADADNLVLAVSDQLDCASEDFGDAAERVPGSRRAYTSMTWLTSSRCMQQFRTRDDRRDCYAPSEMRIKIPQVI